MERKATVTCPVRAVCPWSLEVCPVVVYRAEAGVGVALLVASQIRWEYEERCFEWQKGFQNGRVAEVTC